MFTKDYPQERMPWVNWNGTKIFLWSLTALIKFIRQIQKMWLYKSAILGFRISCSAPRSRPHCYLAMPSLSKKKRDFFIPCCSYLGGSGFGTGLPIILLSWRTDHLLLSWLGHKWKGDLFLPGTQWAMPAISSDRVRCRESNSVSFRSALHSPWCRLVKLNLSLKVSLGH